MARAIYEAIYYAVFSNFQILSVIEFYRLISTVPKPILVFPHCHRPNVNPQLLTLQQCKTFKLLPSLRTEEFNQFEHTAGSETVETSMSFACNSSFLSVDGMTCLIPFQSLRNDLSNGISFVEIVSMFRL